ncbi:MAG: nitroreductase family protein [Dehalococcoidia bacterium]|nr:nitroreductase family protein [Dehalococcoidia bacterium]
MDVHEAIEKRRTIRAFKQGVSEEQLRKLLLAGVKAPSGSNVQPWELIVIDDPKIIEQIAEYKYQQSLKMALDAMALNDPAVIEKIYTQTLETPLSTRMAERQKNAYRNCTVIAVCNKKGHGIGRKPWMNIENIASTWMCIENMALAATADGLGFQISILREEHKIAVEKLLGVPEDYELATMVMIGVPAEVPRKKEVGVARPDFSWLHRNKFGNKE